MARSPELPDHVRILSVEGQQRGDPRAAYVEVQCPQCHERDKFLVSMNGLRDWVAGMLIQEAMSGLTVTQREQLITGTCQACWDAMWPRNR